MKKLKLVINALFGEIFSLRFLSKGACFVLAVLLVLSCNNESSDTNQKPISSDKIASNAKMANRLQKLHQSIDPLKVSYHSNSQRAEFFKNKLEEGGNYMETTNYRAQYAYELLLSGKTDQSIIEIERLLQEFIQNNAPAPQRYNLKQLLAMAYMRLGEQENCIKENKSNSCILPIQGDGIYRLTKGPETAIKIYTEMLSERPEDMETKWLLNLAYMTIGGYPNSVPPKYLIREHHFMDDQSIEAFKNITSHAVFGRTQLAGGVCLEDFNKDGLLDIISSSWGVNDQVKYFQNLGNGEFQDKTDETGLLGITGGLNMIHADFNNDGNTDVLVLRGAWFGDQGKIPNSLLQNNGDGTFTDVTEEVGLLSFYPTQTATWADFNRDGWVDLFIGNETTVGAEFPCELYINERGTFRNVIAETPLNTMRGLIKGVCSGDINNDGWPDIYISMVGQSNKLFLNNGKTEGDTKVNFKDISNEAGVGLPIESFPCWMWDYDHDGLLDIFVAPFNIKQYTAARAMAGYFSGDEVVNSQIVIYKNLGNNSFRDIAQEMKLEEPIFAMGGNYGDINNDGYWDFYLGTGTPNYSALVPNKMYLNKAGNSFSDVSYSSRLAHLQKGHGVSFGDIDNDGDQDIFHVIGGAFEGDVFSDALFVNPLKPGTHYLRVLFEGTSANRSCIGLKFKVSGNDENGKELEFYHTVSTGGSFGSSSLRQEIGLGNIKSNVRIEIEWPDAQLSKQVIDNIELDKFIKITQGNPKV